MIRFRRTTPKRSGDALSISASTAVEDGMDVQPIVLRPPKSSRAGDQSVFSRDGARRVLIVGRLMIGMVTLIMLVLLGRVAQLQTEPPAPVRQYIDSHYSRTPIEGRRGDIRARDGRPMAVTQSIQQLFVDPALIQEHGSFSERVAFSLHYDPIELERRLSPRMNSRFVVIDPRLDEERMATLSELRLAGLGTQSRLVREYPQGSLAAHIIGFVGFEGQGLEGLEQAMERQLRGEDGAMRYLRDAGRQAMWVEQQQYVPHRDGQSIYLTIDLTIQAIAEQELTAACEKFNAKAGTLVVMNPRTGEILAMANYPGYDPRDISASSADARRNRAVTDFFEPGSIFKPFIWAAAVEGGFAHPDERFDAHGGHWISPRGRRLRDAYGYGQLTWEETLVRSSNIIMAKVGMRMGEQRLHDAVRSFGFGSPTGSELPGEVGGLVRPLRDSRGRSLWSHYSVTSVPMGQEVGVTALQAVSAFCVFGNDGMLVTPTILLPQQPGDEVPRPRIFRRILSPATAELTRRVMRRAVTEGTGRHAQSELYTIFGKTGTAQVAGPTGGYIPGKYVGSFLAGAPTENPQIIVGCFIHEPDPALGYYGGLTAAPAARNVIERSLIHMGIAPSNVTTADPNRVVRITD